jgi:hypothetical protein
VNYLHKSSNEYAHASKELFVLGTLQFVYNALGYRGFQPSVTLLQIETKGLAIFLGYCE